MSLFLSVGIFNEGCTETQLFVRILESEWFALTEYRNKKYAADPTIIDTHFNKIQCLRVKEYTIMQLMHSRTNTVKAVKGEQEVFYRNR